jgi:magnesium-transporting ATPase (P-type)
MPLAPIQILGMCGVAHVWPALTYYLNPLADEAMYVPPRRKDAKLVPRHTLMWIVIPWMLLFSAAWTGSSCYAFYQHTGHVFTVDIATAEGVAAAKQANPFVTDENPRAPPGLDTTQPASASVEEVAFTRKGSQIARTMNFVTVCIAELGLALAVSTAEPLAIFRLHNPALTMTCAVMAVLTFIAIYMPLVMPQWAEWTGLVPLEFPEVSVSVGVAVAAHMVFELFKIGYRNESRYLIELRRYHALATKKGLLSVNATDAQVEAYRRDHPLNELTEMV